ncbi:sigma-70 family RNA polymerase sigma factor [Sphingomonas lenta]|uniref:FliA/WhiG family RNA polymerase sigma factor n=1 Tax=Sphingomonas lenta TaxID=1141887 RepID=A0A2A2SFA1_9SPHN|nr:RNA polymerase sigma factor FliA [Sphingomonas lenta]PAX07946.1 FliA/WhiG family RNA polymerase sigma factor [Sphingomonas lenta]
MSLYNPGSFDNAQPVTYKPNRGTDDAIRQHLPLVRRLAWHVHGSMSTSVDVEDLVQVGLVALVEALASAEARSGPEFRQYLTTRLRGAMIDELRRQATGSRGAMRRRREYARAVEQLTLELGRAPGDAEVAGRLGVTPDKLRQEYAAADGVRLESIDDVYQDDLPWFASSEPDAFDALAEGEQRDALVAAIAGLPEREQLVIQLYYVEELNLEEIGQVLGVGQARVCQIKKSAHDRLKRALAG